MFALQTVDVGIQEPGIICAETSPEIPEKFDDFRKIGRKLTHFKSSESKMTRKIGIVPGTVPGEIIIFILSVKVTISLTESILDY